jgi:sec-independent protein translocase protein TatC
LPVATRPVGHEDQLSLVEHLDELRSRLIVCVIGFMIAFGIAAWQNHALLDVVNRPLEKTTSQTLKKGSAGRLESTARTQLLLRRALVRGAAVFNSLAKSETVKDPALRLELRAALRDYRLAVQALPTKTPGRQPVTLGVAEPFSTTLTISIYFALLFSLPLILYQMYAFVLPAFTPSERKVALPLMMMVPVLFVSGVLFGYFVVLPPAVKFLQSFNSQSFDVLVQAKPYYTFVVLGLISMGVLFQIPVGVLALTRAGIITVKQLRDNRRYAVVGLSVLAMLLPTIDPVTLILEIIPLLALYELSILVAAWVDRIAGRREAAGDAGNDLALTDDSPDSDQD